MGTKKKAIFITDGSRSVRVASLLVKEILQEKEYKLKVIPAKKFLGNDLLPADIFFIGSKKAKPKSFEYLNQFLSHVNLAGRKAGLIGFNEKTIKYLTTIITDSEAIYGEPLLASEETNKDTVAQWLIKAGICH